MLIKRRPEAVNRPELFVLLLFVLPMSLYIIHKAYEGSLDFSKRFEAEKISWLTEHGFRAFGDETQEIPSNLNVFRERIGSRENRLEDIILDIKFSDYKKLAEKRDQALKLEKLVQTEDSFVKAKIRHKDETFKVEVRLKGDGIDHIKGKKWSFRVKVKGGKSIFNMRQFSLQDPRTRAYQSEPLFYKLMDHVGVLRPRYLFVNLIVNGENLGIMAVEEHFSKEILEANQRKESVIAKFDESLLWANFPLLHHGYSNYRSSSIDFFGESKIKKSATLSRDRRVAIGLLRRFVSLPTVEASSVFDAGQMGRFLAAAEVFGCPHALALHNLRFYFNPINTRFEPIAFDCESATPQPIDLKGIPYFSDIFSVMLRDPVIESEYRKSLVGLLRDLTAGQLGDDLDTLNESITNSLRSELRFLPLFPLHKIKERAKNYIKDLADNEKVYVGPSDVVMGQLRREPIPEFFAYKGVIQSNLIDRDRLEIINYVPHRVLIRKLSWVSKYDAKSIPLESKDGVPILYPLTIEPTPYYGSPGTVSILFNEPKNRSEYELKITSEIVGSGRQDLSVAREYAAPLPSDSRPFSTVEQQLSNHSFLKYDADRQELGVKCGEWGVHADLIVPINTRLRMDCGATLRFAPNTGLIVYGSLQISPKNDGGTVVLTSQVSELESNTWDGIAVIDAFEDSLIENTVISKNSGFSRQTWGLTGSVVFYRSNFKILDSSIEENRSEDALNSIRSQFSLVGVKFSKIHSDAFDSDFSIGTVEDSTFADVGNSAGGGDAVDISGGSISIKKTQFSNINDKAISIGEGGEGYAEGVQISKVGTGAASKDHSKLTIVNASIRGAKVAGLMSYVKKKEYDPATLFATNIDFQNNKNDIIAQDANSIFVNGSKIKTSKVNVDELYNTVMKSTKL